MENIGAYERRNIWRLFEGGGPRGPLRSTCLMLTHEPLRGGGHKVALLYVL